MSADVNPTTHVLMAILRLLIAMAMWQMDSKDADYRTRITWNRLRDAIKSAELVAREGNGK